MNQLAERTERLPMDSVGMSSTGTGSKIAPQTLGEVVKFAEVMCRADIALPKHLRGNAGACMAVAMQAMEWQLSPFAVASKSYAVNGAIAYEAQLIAAVVNTRSGIKGRLKYSFDGEGNALTCTVTGILDGDECVYTSPPIGSITTKNSPLWKSDPQQQLGYFAARSWARRHCPEVILGVYDRDEAEEFRGPDNARDVTPAKQTLSERLTAARGEAEKPQDEQEGFSRAHVARETSDALTGEIIDNTNSATPSTAPKDDLPDTDETQTSSADGGGDAVSSSSAPPSSPDHPDMLDAAPDWLAVAARMLWAATNTDGNTDDNLELLNNQRKAIDVPANATQAQKDKAGSIYKRCKAVVMREEDPTDAIAIIAGIAGCTESEVKGARS